MMDGSMYPRGWHPSEECRNRENSGKAKYYTPTQLPPKYYLIDFGISSRYDADELPVLEDPIHGADRTVPEFKHPDAPPCDPFPTDVYYLGNVFRMDFILVGRCAFRATFFRSLFLLLSNRRMKVLNLWVALWPT